MRIKAFKIDHDTKQRYVITEGGGCYPVDNIISLKIGDEIIPDEYQAVNEPNEKVQKQDDDTWVAFAMLGHIIKNKDEKVQVSKGCADRIASIVTKVGIKNIIITWSNGYTIHCTTEIGE